MPLPSAQQYHSGYISFPASAPPLPSGTSAAQELKSWFFLTNLLSFLCPRRCQHLSDLVFLEDKSHSWSSFRNFCTSPKSSLLSSSSCSFSSSISCGISDKNTTVRSSTELWNPILRKTRPQSRCNRCDFLLTSSASQHHCPLIIRQPAAMQAQVPLHHISERCSSISLTCLEHRLSSC